MKRLNGADAFMLGMETSKAYMHTFKVAIIDPSTDPNGWSFDKFYAEAASRMHVLPMLRWKYLASPLGLNHPYWVDDPDFDLEFADLVVAERLVRVHGGGLFVSTRP